MKIAIDVSPLETGHKVRGVGMYTRHLVDALKSSGGKHTYEYFSGRQTVPKDADIVHYPYFDPFFLTLPVVKRRPTVVTVHDLIPLVFPDKFPSGIRGRVKWEIQKNSLLGVSRIITDSDTSKQDVVRITGYSTHRIDTVYLAPTMPPVPVRSGVMKPKRSSGRKYIIYVGDVNWNKNVPGLLRAFSQIQGTFPDISLTLVGGAFANTDLRETKAIIGLIGQLKLENRVSMPGRVTDEELGKLYRAALCLVVPSFYEGFGIPVLDAMASGCPVVLADNSSLSEIKGPSVPVNADDPGSIASGISTILSQTQRKRDELCSAGYSWVKKFSWRTVAAQTIASYERMGI